MKEEKTYIPCQHCENPIDVHDPETGRYRVFYQDGEPVFFDAICRKCLEGV